MKSLFLFACVGLAGCSGASTPSGPAPKGQADAHPLATITASPNPVIPAADKNQASTTITFSTGDSSQGEVYMATSGQPEQLFCGLASHGSHEAPWISKGGTYEFRLYAGKDHTTLLKSVIVTTTSGSK